MFGAEIARIVKVDCFMLISDSIKMLLESRVWKNQEKSDYMQFK
jgi:hypothetical protein